MTNAIQKTEEKAIEFVPFGSDAKIKLTADIVMRLCATPTKSGKLPSQTDAIQFMMMCSAMKLNPFTRDAYLVGYDTQGGAKFSLITAHVALTKRAEASVDYQGMQSGIILQDGDGKITEREGDFCTIEEIPQVVGGWARVFRKDRKDTYRRLAIHQRKPNYPTQFWEGGKAAEQICKCAEAAALRDTFPTLLGGLYHGAEIIEINASVAPQEMPAMAQLAPPQTGAVQEASNVEVMPTKAETPQQELYTLVTEAGFTFEHLRIWGEDTKNLTDAMSLGNFAEIKTEEAKRLLRAKVGLLKGLEAVKGGAQ